MVFEGRTVRGDLRAVRTPEVSDASRGGPGVFEQAARRLRLIRRPFQTCAATASRPTPSTSGRSRAAGRHEAEFDEFLLGALAESKVDNPVLRPCSPHDATPSPSFSARLGGRARGPGPRRGRRAGRRRSRRRPSTRRARRAGRHGRLHYTRTCEGFPPRHALDTGSRGTAGRFGRLHEPRALLSTPRRRSTR